MKNTRVVIASTAIFLAIFASFSAGIPRAHAFYSSAPSVTVSLGASNFSDPFTGSTVDAVAAGSTLSVNVFIQASTTNPSYQRNVTVGFKGDWMNSYTNASNASPSATMSLTSNQAGTATISVALPSTGSLTPHTWAVAVWDGPLNALNGATCAPGNNAEHSASCDLISYNDAGYIQLAIYTGDQLSGAQANIQANSAISQATTALSLISGSLGPRPGVTEAAGQIAQARTELNSGDQSWRNGDYSGAKTHYQNALNDANAASSALTSGAGGNDSANLANLVLGGTGILLIGVGALLAGLGAFIRYRRKA